MRILPLNSSIFELNPEFKMNVTNFKVVSKPQAKSVLAHVRPKQSNQISSMKSERLGKENEGDEIQLPKFGKGMSTDSAQSPMKSGPGELNKQESQTFQKSVLKQFMGGVTQGSNVKEESPINNRGAKVSIKQKATKEQGPVDNIPNLTSLRTEDLTEEERIRYIQLLESSYAAGEM